MRIMVVGDIHGDLNFLLDRVYPAAQRGGALAILQLGDFGYWEHESSGVAFMDALAERADDTEIPLFWLRGNHDNYRLAMERYGANLTAQRFVRCRRHVLLIPDGLVWTWAGKTLRAFGGAYSPDKLARLDAEQRAYRKSVIRESARRAVGRPRKNLPSTAETLWFSDEELTDQQYVELLETPTPAIDVIVSHDRPSSVTIPGVAVSDDPEWNRNATWLQQVLVHHHPATWLHGHMHRRYMDTVRSGDDDCWTTVFGLASSDAWVAHPSEAWCFMDLIQGAPVNVTQGQVIPH
jgi:hypothetical protein